MIAIQPGVVTTRPRPSGADAKQRKDLLGVLGTSGYKEWYERNQCPGAPVFPHYLAYVIRSLPRRIPGDELASIVWEATHKAFREFEPLRGDLTTRPDGRFLKHWRVRFSNALKSGILKTRPRDHHYELEEFPDPKPRDPDHELTKREIAAAVGELAEERRSVVVECYWRGKSLSDIARSRGRRKAGILRVHNNALGDLSATPMGMPENREPIPYDWNIAV